MKYSQGGDCYAASFEGQGAEAFADTFEATLAGEVPACEGCGEPMKALAILRQHPERFPLERHAALGVFVCTREPGDDWDAWWQACALGNKLDEGGARGGLTALLYAEPPELKEAGKVVGYARIRDVQRSQPAGEPPEQWPYEGIKLGGVPSYLGWGGEDLDFQPTCKECNASMRFLGQLKSDRSLEYEYSGGDFTIFVFACPTHDEPKLEAFVG